jgi:hypothetical protein
VLFKSCIVFHFKDRLKLTFNRVDADLVVTYIKKKFENMSFSWCNISEFNLFTEGTVVDLLGIEELDLIKLIAFTEEDFLEIEVVSSDLTDHAELYNVLVFYEDYWSIYEEVFLETIKSIK